MKRAIFAFALAIVCLMLITVPKQVEASLSGHIFDWQIYAFGGEYNYSATGQPDGSGSFEAMDGNNTSYDTWGPMWFNANGSQLSIWFYNVSEFFEIPESPVSLNESKLYTEAGIRFTDTNHSTIFDDVAIDPNSSFKAAFSASNITWNDHEIAIDLAGLTFYKDELILLNIKTSDNTASVPEPGTLFLFASGIAGILAGRRLFGR